MGVPNAVRMLLLQINEEVDQFPNHTKAELGGILLRAERELSKDLETWLAKAPKGDERFTATQYRNALIQIRGSLTHLDSTSQDVKDLLQKAGVKVQDLAVKHLSTSLSTFSPLFGHVLNPIPMHMVKELVAANSALMPQFASSAARYTAAMRDDIKRQLAIGMIRGETIDQLTNRLQRLGGPKGLVYLRGKAGDPGARAEVISEGLFARYRHWGERLVRTELNNGYNLSALDAVHAAREYEPDLMVRWDAAIDSRTCIRCREMDDKVRKEDEPFPGGIYAPPLHPNCRCAAVAWHKEWTEHNAKNVMGEKAPDVSPAEHKKPKIPSAQKQAEKEAKLQAKAQAKAAKEQAKEQAKKAKEQAKAAKLQAKADERAAKQAAKLGIPPGGFKEFGSVSEALGWGEKAFGPWRKALPPDERGAIISYQGSAYGPINKHLRQGKELDPYWAKTLANLDKALDKTQIPINVKGYRGEGMPPEILAKMQPGTIVVDKAFRSVSTEAKVATKFGTGDVLWEYEIPKGTKGAYISTRGDQFGGTESEILLHRGARFQILSVEKGQGRTIIKARVLE